MQRKRTKFNPLDFLTEHLYWYKVPAYSVIDLGDEH